MDKKRGEIDRISGYRPHGIAVTDLSAQLWCERQLELSLDAGRAETEEMKRGSDRHQALHEEVATLVAVQPKSLEDHVALKLHNSIVGTARLLEGGMTREAPIYGRVNSLFVVGSIDEIAIGAGILRITDTKTRRTDTMPSEQQKRTTRFQLMTYRHLFEDARRGKFTAHDLLASYGFSSGSRITDEFLQEVRGIGEELEPSVSLLAEEAFALLRGLPPASEELEVRYESQQSGKAIGVDLFRFEAELFSADCDFVEGFWLGKRDGVPVGEANRWKCHYCEFKSACYNRADPAREPRG